MHRLSGLIRLLVLTLAGKLHLDPLPIIAALELDMHHSPNRLHAILCGTVWPGVPVPRSRSSSWGRA